METTTSFDLNRALQQWRENLAQSPALRSENLRELEAHLRDSTTTLQTRGLSAEEAFFIATRRIGKGGALEMEFAKVNRRALWLDRILWMLIGVQVWAAAVGVTGAVTRNALSWGWATTHSGNLFDNQGYRWTLPVAIFSAGQVLALGASLVLCWWLVIRKGEKLGARLTPLLQKRSTLVATCMGLFLFSLIAYALNFGIQAVLLRYKYVDFHAYKPTTAYLAYSQMLAWSVQAITMIILTLALARKRLRASQVFD
jgi:hypothetical protein